MRKIILIILISITFPVVADRTRDIQEEILASEDCTFFFVGYSKNSIAWIGKSAQFNDDACDGTHSFSKDSISLFVADIVTGKISHKTELLGRSEKTGMLLPDPSMPDKQHMVKIFTRDKKSLRSFKSLPSLPSGSVPDSRKDSVTGWEFFQSNEISTLRAAKDAADINLGPELESRIDNFSFLWIADIRKLDPERFVLFIGVSKGDEFAAERNILTMIVRVTGETLKVERIF
jgi:hypothetical protein